MRETPSTTDSDKPAQTTDASSGAALGGNLGVVQLLFTILAFNGPLTVVVGIVPLVIGYGNGLGAPVAYLVAALVVATFAAGFTKMARHVENPGGFYSFVALGLGRRAGLGASFLALVCYYLVLLASYAFIGITVESVVRDTLHGPSISWWVWALVAQLTVGVLGYFRLDISARFLMVLMAGEVLIIIAYDAAVVASGGSERLTASFLMSSNITSGSAGLALLFAMLCMAGFEATVIFRQEVRAPERTIPRAAYGFIATVAVLFGITAWAVTQALGDRSAVAATATDPVGSLLGTVRIYLGAVGLDLVSVLLATSILAALVSSHNILSRYLFSLGVDGILPGAVGKAHRRHKSPHRASVTVSIVAFIGLLPFMIFDDTPATLYAKLSGAFGYSFVLLLACTGLAIPVYLNRVRPASVTVWHRIVAPVLALAGMAIALYLATDNIELLIGAGTSVIVILMVIVYGSFVLGFAVASVFRRTKPDVFERIGRQ
ncbi:APC family permease [Pseudonocardia kujensis]|uniref:APC family permease n=1 Tax=Pseudonocardia kujensis TaxID=1128675 RepID=UPI001E43721F|nr:APC family permease [Pseudonocardia kujensis]MCE0763706.1 APC family permease [Pseudonocardia kujensis]